MYPLHYPKRVEVVVGEQYVLSKVGQETLPDWARSIIESAYLCRLGAVAFTLIGDTLKVIEYPDPDVSIAWEVRTDRRLEFLDLEGTYCHGVPEHTDNSTNIIIFAQASGGTNINSFDSLVK